MYMISFLLVFYMYMMIYLIMLIGLGKAAGVFILTVWFSSNFVTSIDRMCLFNGLVFPKFWQQH